MSTHKLKAAFRCGRMLNELLWKMPLLVFTTPVTAKMVRKYNHSTDETTMPWDDFAEEIRVLGETLENKEQLQSLARQAKDVWIGFWESETYAGDLLQVNQDIFTHTRSGNTELAIEATENLHANVTQRIMALRDELINKHVRDASVQNIFALGEFYDQKDRPTPLIDWVSHESMSTATATYIAGQGRTLWDITTNHPVWEVPWLPTSMLPNGDFCDPVWRQRLMGRVAEVIPDFSQEDTPPEAIIEDPEDFVDWLIDRIPEYRSDSSLSRGNITPPSVAQTGSEAGESVHHPESVGENTGSSRHDEQSSGVSDSHSQTAESVPATEWEPSNSGVEFNRNSLSIRASSSESATVVAVDSKRFNMLLYLSDRASRFTSNEELLGKAGEIGYYWGSIKSVNTWVNRVNNAITSLGFQIRAYRGRGRKLERRPDAGAGSR